MTTGSPVDGDTPAGEVNVFAVELERWRDVRGFSRAALAERMGYDRSYVSKILSGGENPSEAFARHAEQALRAGGALTTAFHDYRSQRSVKPRPPAPAAPPEGPTLGSLVVDHDDATLRYDNGIYTLTQRRRLINHSDAPIARYLVRISVDWDCTRFA